MEMELDLDLMTVEAVAARIGLGKRRVYQLIHAGLIPSITIGRSIRVPTRAWEEWLERQCRVAIGRTGEKTA